jgi:hypothetical protein
LKTTDVDDLVHIGRGIHMGILGRRSHVEGRFAIVAFVDFPLRRVLVDRGHIGWDIGVGSGLIFGWQGNIIFGVNLITVFLCHNPMSKSFKQFIPPDPFLLTEGQSAFEELVSLGGEVRLFEYLCDGDILQCSQQLLLISCFPGGISMNHFVEDDAERPDVAFCCVLGFLEDLRDHVYRTAHKGFEHLRAVVVHIFGEAEVTDFVHSVIDEDVGRFQITMYDFLLDEFLESAEQLCYNFESFFLLESLPFDQLFEVAILAELGDYVETVFGTEDIFEFDDVRVVELLEEVDLGEDRFLEITIIGECNEVDFFYCYLLFGLPLQTFIDFSVDSLTKTSGGLIGIVTNHFDDYFVH